MSDTPESLKPLKTWSHLANRRKRPSEYEVVTTNLNYHTDNPDVPWELDPNLPMNKWYVKYRNLSPLKHPDWDAYRDPDEIIYRTYTVLQDGQESYVTGLLDQFSSRGHDHALTPEWLAILARLYAPSRYLFHTVQMASAYIQQMAPASTITSAATYQTADSLRWLSHTAYRTRELANAHPNAGFGTTERALWETDPAWQGFRELMERALVKMALETEGNQAVMQNWLSKWTPLANQAITAYCTALPNGAAAATAAIAATDAFRKELGFS